VVDEFLTGCKTILCVRAHFLMYVPHTWATTHKVSFLLKEIW